MAPGTLCMRTTVTSDSCFDATVLTGKVTGAAAPCSQMDGASGCSLLSVLCRGVLETQVHLCVVLATAHWCPACHMVMQSRMLIHCSYGLVDHAQVAVFSCC